MSQAIDVGSIAPDFTLPSHTGGDISSRELRGKGPFVVFFYPKDNTPGCTKEVCAFRDHYEEFVAAGCQLIGISDDPIKNHVHFAEGNKLTYPLLSDEGGAVARAWGVTKSLGIMPGRVTFVVDGEGKVRHRFSSQFDIQKHIADALAVVQELKAKPNL
jgi:peroxiredoxin Q/BCP